jgi:type IV pilus secretin PilQ/predicted competence protein
MGWAAKLQIMRRLQHLPLKIVVLGLSLAAGGCMHGMFRQDSTTTVSSTHPASIRSTATQVVDFKQQGQQAGVSEPAANQSAVYEEPIGVDGSASSGKVVPLSTTNPNATAIPVTPSGSVLPQQPENNGRCVSSVPSTRPHSTSNTEKANAANRKFAVPQLTQVGPNERPSQIRFETAESLAKQFAASEEGTAMARSMPSEKTATSETAVNPPSYNHPIPQLTPVANATPVQSQNAVETPVVAAAPDPAAVQSFPIPQLTREKVKATSQEAFPTVDKVAATPKSMIPPSYKFPAPRLTGVVPKDASSDTATVSKDSASVPSTEDAAQFAGATVPEGVTNVQLATWDASVPNEPAESATRDGSARMAQFKATTPELVPAPKGNTPDAKSRSTATPTSTGTGTASQATSSDGAPLITLHVDNLEITKAIELISRQARIVNILVSPGVTGTVTVDLRNKTVDEALEILAKQCRLKVRREKDIIYVSTLEESRQVESDDLPVRLYYLNYITSTDAETMITKVLSKDGKVMKSPDAKTGLESDFVDISSGGSSGGTKKVDAGGNSLAGGEVLIVQDHEYVLKTVDRIIAQLDIKPVQVMIEAVLVQVTLDKNMDLGANFSFLDGAGRAAAVLGSGGLINTAGGFSPGTVVNGSGQLQGILGANTYGMKVGWNGNTTAGYIQALETYGKVKVLACPRLFVLNKQRAELQLGSNLGYQTTTVNQTSSTQTVSYVKTGTQLRIRPYVSSDGMIRMEVHPERSTGALDNNGIPQTKSSQVTTNVIVPDGTTMVIGGLMDEEVSEGWSGLPLLSRLPWLGYLFRHSTDTTAKKELVVILTPHIWRPENPTGTNCIGGPKTLGLREKVSQKPCEERRDGPALLESIPACQECPCPSPANASKSSQATQASAKNTNPTSKPVQRTAQTPGNASATN